MTAPPVVAPTDLTQRLTRAIDRVVWSGGTDGPLLAALRVLAEPEIADGQAALAVLSRLREHHQPVPWGEDSDVIVCSCGSGAFDACADGLILRGLA